MDACPRTAGEPRLRPAERGSYTADFNSAGHFIMHTHTIKLSTSQVKNIALNEAGVSRVAYGKRPGTRVHRNKVHESRIGKAKHKGRHCD